MKIATVHVQGQSPYAQSRFHGIEKLPREGAEDYEKRTWPNKAHIDPDGNIYVPPLAFKKCIAEAAKYLSKQIPGKGKSTYTKHFQSGVLVTEGPIIHYKGKTITAESIDQEKSGYYEERLFVPADGVAGSGKRVFRSFPLVREGWECDADFIIVDDIITEEVFKEHLAAAGMLIGVGAFRVRNGGTMGRFSATVTKWAEYETLVD